MRKTEVEKMLENIGVNTRDDNGSIRSSEELAEEVMVIFNQCEDINKVRLIVMLELAKRMDDDMYYLYQYE